MEGREAAEAAGRLNRREMLAAGAAWPLFATVPLCGPLAPSNRIGVGCIGLNGMGLPNLRGFLARPEARVVAVCDVEREFRERACGVAKLPPEAAYTDFRELLRRPDVDAVVIATPDHWHAPMAVAAVRAGKDVYCEKPLTLTVAEGRVLSDEARRRGRVVQVGSQQRSDARFRFACELVRNGRIGRIRTVRVAIPENSRPNPAAWRTGPAPAGLDWDLWLGPAPWAPYTPERVHYNFRFFHDYSGGQLTNWGAHYVDIAHWGLGADRSGPVAVDGAGSEFPRGGLFETATLVNLAFTYPGGARLFVRTGGQGTRFEGDEGWIFVNRERLEAHPASLLRSAIRPGEIRLPRSRDHREDFLRCIRTRGTPVADVETGHRTITACHLGNISMRLGRPLRWDPAAERFLDDDAANRMISRPRRSPWQL